MWTGTTPKINGHNFVWTDHVGGDISKTSMFRFSVKGTNDSYICFAEEKTDDAKKITYVLGGWGNSTSTVKWMPKGQKGNNGWHGSPSDPHTYKG